MKWRWGFDVPLGFSSVLFVSADCWWRLGVSSKKVCAVCEFAGQTMLVCFGIVRGQIWTWFDERPVCVWSGQRFTLVFWNKYKDIYSKHCFISASITGRSPDCVAFCRSPELMQSSRLSRSTGGREDASRRLFSAQCHYLVRAASRPSAVFMCGISSIDHRHSLTAPSMC